MRSLVLRSFGEPSVLAVATVAVPAPAAGQVRIRTAAAAVHPVDVGTRSGALGALLPERAEYQLGWDLAGHVDAVGSPDTGFAVGDPVVALTDWFDDLVGTQADQLVLDATKVAPAPRDVPLGAAAGLPLNGLTATQALDLLELQPGRSLVVLGAAGAVGGFAVELAVGRGLQVIGVAGESDRAFVTGLGARFVPRSTDVAAAVDGVLPGGADGVLDTALLGPDALGAVRDGGALVTVFGPAAPDPVRGIRVQAVSVRSDGAGLAALVDLVDAGRLTLRRPRPVDLAEAATAHELLAKGGLREPIVLTFADDANSRP